MWFWRKSQIKLKNIRFLRTGAQSLPQFLNGNGRVAGEKRGLPAMAGEQQDLPLLRLLPQPLQSGFTAGTVKIRQGVVQNNGDFF